MKTQAETHPHLTLYSLLRYYGLSSTLCKVSILTLNLPTTTIVAQPFNVIKWQLKFKPVAYGLMLVNFILQL